MKHAILGLGLLIAVFRVQAQKKIATPTPPYKNPKLPVEARIQDLLGRMTLEEKVAQTYAVWLDKDKVYQTNYQFDEKKAENGLLKLGIGHIARASETSISGSRAPAENAKITNDIQRFLTTKTRLGIPAIIHEEALHGHQAKDATHFPSHLALSSSWNEELFTEIYAAIAKEIRSRGGHHVLAPVVDIARDPRWGRTEETLGEDPLLTGRLATAAVKAYQGQGPTIGKENVAATLKHFGIHGAPEGGVNIAPAYMDERSAREQLLFPF
jgi:beta-glucosidase